MFKLLIDSLSSRLKFMALIVCAGTFMSLGVTTIEASATDVAPVINSDVAAPLISTPSGGIVILTATVSGPSGTSCSVVTSPTSVVTPSSLPCSGSRVKVRFHWDRNSNVADKAFKYVATLHVTTAYADGSHQTVSQTSHFTISAYHSVITSAKVVFPMQPTAISCASASNCAVVGTNGYVGIVSKNRVHVIHVDGGNSLTAVSCADQATMQCLAVDNLGNGIVYSGGKWSSVTKVGDATNPNRKINSVSCQTVGSTHQVVCHTVDENGQILRVVLQKLLLIVTDGDSNTGLAKGPSFVGCVPGAPDTCAALDASGNEVSSSAGLWSIPNTLVLDGGSSEGSIESLSCVVNSECVAVFAHHVSIQFAINAPSTSTNSSMGASTLSSPVTSASCATPAFCMASDQNGLLFKGVVHPLKPGQVLVWGGQAATKSWHTVLVSCAGGSNRTSPLGCTGVPSTSGAGVLRHDDWIIISS